MITFATNHKFLHYVEISLYCKLYFSDADFDIWFMESLSLSALCERRHYIGYMLFQLNFQSIALSMVWTSAKYLAEQINID